MSYRTDRIARAVLALLLLPAMTLLYAGRRHRRQRALESMGSCDRETCIVGPAVVYMATVVALLLYRLVALG